MAGKKTKVVAKTDDYGELAAAARRQPGKIKINQYRRVKPATGPSQAFVFSEAVVDFDGDRLDEASGPNWKKAADELLKSNKGKSQKDFIYRAYMRAIIDGQPVSHLVGKFPAVKKARTDLIDHAGKLEGYDGDVELSLDEASGVLGVFVDELIGE